MFVNKNNCFRLEAEMNINQPVNFILRIVKNMTHEDLAKKIGVARTYLTGVISGNRESKIVKLKVSRELGRPLSELWPEDAA